MKSFLRAFNGSAVLFTMPAYMAAEEERKKKENGFSFFTQKPHGWAATASGEIMEHGMIELMHSSLYTTTASSLFI